MMAATASASVLSEGRVAIVGAGPAGLVAAKELLEAGLDVVVFEKSQRVVSEIHHVSPQPPRPSPPLPTPPHPGRRVVARHMAHHAHEPEQADVLLRRLAMAAEHPGVPHRARGAGLP